MNNKDYHQFSFERSPHSKLSELQCTLIEKTSFFSQLDPEAKPHININHEPHPFHKFSPQGSPLNKPSLDPYSLLILPEFYTTTKEKQNLKRKLLFFASFSFIATGTELIVGFICNSFCLMIDSLRLFYLFKSFFVPYLAMRMHEIPPNKVYTYGYQRFEVLVSLSLIVIQWSVIFGLVIEGSKRWGLAYFELRKEPMLITAFVGLLLNLILRRTLSYIKGQEGFQEIKRTQEQQNVSCVCNRKKEEGIIFPL